MKKTGQSILKGLHEALDHHQGKKTGARVHKFSATDVASIRKSVGLSQQQFSDEFEIALPTLRKWEQGKRVPHGPAHVLLRVIAVSPSAVLKALKHS